MKKFIFKKGLPIGIVLGFTLGILLGPLVAFSGSGNANSSREKWQQEFFTPLLWAVHHIENHYIEEVTPRQLLRGAYSGIMSELDRYSSYIPAERLDQFEEDTHGEFGGLGIQITFDPMKKILRVEEPIPGTPAFRQGVMASDIITKIFDYPTDKKYKASELESIHEAVRILRGEPGTNVRITVIHENTGEEKEFLITRELIEIPGVQAPAIVDEQYDIGYIYVPTFHERTIEDLRKAVNELREKGMRALILDFRFNPGGLLSSAIEVSDMFMEDSVVVSTDGRTSPKEVFRTRTDDVLTKAPIAVLVNRYSASASEIFAGAIADNNRGIIIGETTFGKGSVQTVLPLQNREGALKLTTSAYYTPSGVSIEEKGIVPHIEIKLGDEDNRRLARRLSDINLRYPDPDEDDSEKNGSDPDTKAPDAADENDFEDVQLLRATDVLKALLISGAF